MCYTFPNLPQAVSMRMYNELALEGVWRCSNALSPLTACVPSNGRATSAISHECLRASANAVIYKPQVAQQRSQRCRSKSRAIRKLDDSALWETVQALLQARWSPEQITWVVARGFPSAASHRVPHETIYSTVYLGSRGELRKDLIGCSVSAGRS
jgi:IS30 family transposase